MKIEIPNLPKWDGNPSNFFPWKERAMDTLGQAGILKYIGDTRAVKEEPQVAEAVFFVIRKALSRGTAQTSAIQLIQQGTKDPILL